MKHTPGPWEWKQSRGNNRYEHSVFTHHQIIAALDGDTNVSDDFQLSENIKANARLIAAAPELLEACKQALSEFADPNRGPSGPAYTIEVIKQAIAKTKEA